MKRLGDGIKRAALYTRVSSDEQARCGYSLPEQMEALERFAAENKLVIIGRYIDDGYSAFSSYKKRPEFMRLLGDIKADKIDVVLFIKLDRWFRKVSSYYEIQSILDAHHVQWLTTEEDYDTTTANGRALLGMRLVMAQAESDNTSDRIKFVFRGKKARGEVVSGKIPLGYQIEDKHLVIVPEEAEKVRGIFETYLRTRSLGATLRWYNETYATQHTVYFIKGRLIDTKYIGLAYDNPDFCPPIIDADDFKRAQELQQTRAQRNSSTVSDHVYLFSGIARCGVCGRSMHAERLRDRPYYRCRRSVEPGVCSNRGRISEERIEDYLLNSLVLQMEEYNADIETRQKALKKKSPVEKLRKKIDKLRDLYLNDLIDREDYEREYRQYTAALEAAAASEIVPDPVNIPALKAALELYKTLPREAQKAFWCKTIKRIEISAEKDIFVYPV